MTISVTLSRTCGASTLTVLVLAALPTLAQARDDAPVTDAYCSEYPARSTGASPVFTSSTKSRSNGAPELPPPPYTSLTPRVASVDTAALAAPAADTPPVSTRASAVSAPVAVRLTCTQISSGGRGEGS